MRPHPLARHLPRLCLGVALAAIAGFVAIEWRSEQPSAATPTNQALAVSNVPLIDESGRRATLGDLSGRWLVVFFGYATCPDVCPTSLAYLHQELQQAGAGDGVRGVFVSVDPQRDKPDALGRYVHYFDPQFVALTGTEANLRALTKQLGVYFERQPAPQGSPDTAYTLAHTASFFVLSPRGELVQTVSPPFERGAVASALAQARNQAH